MTIVVAIVSVRLLHWLEESMDWHASLNPETTRSVMGTLAGAMFTFIVFVCSSLLLVVQLASAQLTPRVIGTMFRDPVTKITLSVFVFTFTFVLAAILRIDDTVPLLITYIGAYGCLVSIAVFLFLIDHVGKLLRPNGVLAVIATQAHAVIENVYPRRLTDAQKLAPDFADGLNTQTGRPVKGTTTGVVLAFDVPGLVKLGTRYDCVIEMMPQVGTSQPVEGMVDKNSQRAAWVVSGTKRPLMEVGIFNLTKDTAPALVHFENAEPQQVLLIRMDEPKK